MTHDELVRFAAGKVGEEIYYDENISDQPMCFGTEDIFDLTSPELMLKGLEVLQQESGVWLINPHSIEIWLNGYPRTKYFSLPIRTVNETPLTFWQCWTKLSEEYVNEK